MNSYRYRVVRKLLRNGESVDYINPETILHTEIINNRLSIWYLEHKLVKQTMSPLRLQEELKLKKKGA